MSDGFETISKLRAQYDDDESLADIQAQEERLKELLEAKQYSLLAETQKLIGILRGGVVRRRLTLATDATLDEVERTALFEQVYARLDLLNVLTPDFDAEIAAMERDLKAKLDA